MITSGCPSEIPFCLNHLKISASLRHGEEVSVIFEEQGEKLQEASEESSIRAEKLWFWSKFLIYSIIVSWCWTEYFFFY